MTMALDMQPRMQGIEDDRDEEDDPGAGGEVRAKEPPPTGGTQAQARREAPPARGLRQRDSGVRAQRRRRAADKQRERQDRGNNGKETFAHSQLLTWDVG